MDESTNTLLYTATYVFIFIIATSLSIILFLKVNKFADSAFEYKEGISGAIINSVSTGLDEYSTGMTPLTKDDVFSYVVNYIKCDLYGSSRDNSEYNIEVDGLSFNQDTPYSKIYNSLTDGKYYIEWVSENSGVKNLVIKKL